MTFLSGLVMDEILIPGAERHMQIVGPEWAYTRVSMHNFADAPENPNNPGREDADEASTRKGKAQPDNKDYTRPDRSDEDMASTRKGPFQPGPEKTDD